MPFGGIEVDIQTSIGILMVKAVRIVKCLLNRLKGFLFQIASFGDESFLGIVLSRLARRWAIAQ